MRTERDRLGAQSPDAGRCPSAPEPEADPWASEAPWAFPESPWWPPADEPHDVARSLPESRRARLERQMSDAAWRFPEVELVGSEAWGFLERDVPNLNRLRHFLLKRLRKAGWTARSSAAFIERVLPELAGNLEASARWLSHGPDAEPINLVLLELVLDALDGKRPRPEDAERHVAGLLGLDGFMYGSDADDRQIIRENMAMAEALARLLEESGTEVLEFFALAASLLEAEADAHAWRGAEEPPVVAIWPRLVCLSLTPTNGPNAAPLALAA